MKEDNPIFPPILDYERLEEPTEPPPVGTVTHKQQYLIMFGIAGFLIIGELITLRALYPGNFVLFACILVCLLIGNDALKEHRKGK